MPPDARLHAEWEVQKTQAIERAVAEMHPPRPPQFAPVPPQFAPAEEAVQAASVDGSSSVVMTAEVPTTEIIEPETTEAVAEVDGAAEFLAATAELQASSGISTADVAAEEPAVDEPATAAVATEVAVDAPQEQPSSDQAASTVVAEAPPTQIPAWVVSPVDHVDNNPARVLTSDPFETGGECEVDLRARVSNAIQEYARDYSQELGGPMELSFPVSNAERQMVCREHFVDVIDTTVGPMRRAHELVVFDDAFRSYLDRRISQVVVGQRLTQTGVASGGVLVFLASVFLAFRATTRPYNLNGSSA